MHASSCGRKLSRTILVIVILTVAACAGEPTMQEGPDAEMTFDDLFRIDNAAFQEAWADPDADWQRYDQIIAGDAFFEFRAVKKTNGTTRANSSQDEFWIDEKSRAKLKDEVSAAFSEELAKSDRFTVAEAPKSNVLVIRGGLHDIVSRIPPDRVGRNEIYLTSVGEATLVLEIVDSLSGEVLFRAVDRRAAERAGGQAIRSNTVTNWAEVRRLARGWGAKLRTGLDSLPTE